MRRGFFENQKNYQASLPQIVKQLKRGDGGSSTALVKHDDTMASADVCGGGRNARKFEKRGFFT